MPTLGVFLIPPADHPLYRLGSDLVGYDIRAQRRFTPLLADELGAERCAAWFGAAPTYGLHATLAAGNLTYDDADVEEVRQRLAWIASRTAPFTLVDGRIDDAFHANPHALVATFDSPDGALRALHRRAVTTISPLRVGSGYARAEDRLPERAREIYHRTGEPWALDLFAPHWSLATNLPDSESWATLRELVLRRTGLFADEATRTLRVTDVERGDDGFYTIAASYPLTG